MTLADLVHFPIFQNAWRNVGPHGVIVHSVGYFGHCHVEVIRALADFSKMDIFKTVFLLQLSIYCNDFFLLLAGSWFRRNLC